MLWHAGTKEHVGLLSNNGLVSAEKGLQQNQ